MSETAAERPGKTQPSRLAQLRIGRRVALLGGAVFWGWLVVRWLNDFFLAERTGLPAGEPLVDPVLVEPFSERVAFAMQYLPELSRGVWLTVVLTVAGIALGFVFAVPLSVARVYGGRASRWLSLSITELIRGTPLLAQLFVLYYGLNLSQYVADWPTFGGLIPIPAVYVAIVGFTVNSAAYQAEYIRSALLGIETSQLTAGRAIGLSKLQTIRFVILPQGLRLAIPGWTNELVYLIKYSSLAAFITVPELFQRAQNIASSNFRYMAVFTLVGLVYLAIVLSASALMGYVERRFAIPGVGTGEGRDRS